MLATSAPDTLIGRRDLAFLLYEWLDTENLLTRPRYAEHSREVFDDVLELAERIARERFAPHNRDADEHEPQVQADGTVALVREVGPALRAFFEAGLAGATLPASAGGLELPHVIGSAAFAQFQAANAATAAYAMLTTAAANLLIANGSPEQIERYVAPMVAGRFFGTMCLSETQAGSSLADITTRAEPQPDGSYRLFGSKMWISGGDHELAQNIVPPGSRGSACSSSPASWWRRTEASASATTWRSPDSTTRWASAAPSTPCWPSAMGSTGRGARQARSDTSSMSPTTGSPTCST
jgi:butyryl-CoA dehydrogenase